MGRYILPILVVFASFVSAQGDDTLDVVRSEVRSSGSSSSSDTKSKDSKPCDQDSYWTASSSSGDGIAPQDFGRMVLGIVASPFGIPHNVIGDDLEIPSTFVTYPYARGWPGAMQRGMDIKQIDGVTPYEWERRFSFRASVEEGNNFDGLNRVGLTFLADSFTRFGVGGGVHFYEEKRPGDSPDHLAIGDVNLLFRFAQSERVQFRTGLGARFLTDRVQTDWGWNFVYGAEAYPFKPVSWSWQLETGTLGEAWVFRATTRLGLVWKYSEAYVGYDYLRIGHAELQGPMVGLRVWF